MTKKFNNFSWKSQIRKNANKRPFHYTASLFREMSLVTKNCGLKHLAGKPTGVADRWCEGEQGKEEQEEETLILCHGRVGNLNPVFS